MDGSMSELDRELAKLNLLNKAELRPASSVSSPGGKKIGPAVPPKPKKTQPLVPQSEPLNHTPSYAARLPNSASTATTYQNAPYCDALPPPPSDGTYVNLPPGLYQSYQDEYAPVSVRAGAVNMGPRGYAKPDQVTYSNLQVRRPEGAYENLMGARGTGTERVYGNLPQGNGGYRRDDLPPPPPPLEMSGNLPGYEPCTVNTNLPPPPEDLLPPPSPVSSSYSELRRATQPGQDYGNYGHLGGSQTSSTYESIYEPINPRPASQLSSRSNYSLYAPYGSASTLTGPSQSASRIGSKEQEIDALTDMLVHGLDNDHEDVYGFCAKCGGKIIGENSGCTAMDKLYHISCFTCDSCKVYLQGKPFYAIRDKPYCEDDYMNTLEKCCVCQKPILDRILRATGKPYHPTCFCCVVCGKSLDGVPFTVDASNQVHCLEDFHNKFAPRCWVCKQPIMPEPGEEETVRVVALDHSFHIQCYKCEDCGLVLSSEAEGRGCYPLDGHVLCKSCNAKRIQALTSKITTEL